MQELYCAGAGQTHVEIRDDMQDTERADDNSESSAASHNTLHSVCAADLAYALRQSVSQSRNIVMEIDFVSKDSRQQLPVNLP
jgi:hypothetical protein